MALNFPSLPNTNDTYTLLDRTWKFNGSAWEIIPNEAGYTGSQGIQGYTGSQGDIGYTGSQGDIGYTGSQGDIGYTGSAAEFIYSLNSNLTGDGSTTTFTINSGRTAIDLLVSINGILFQPTEDYTVSGSSLTFVVAPTSGDEIRIRYLPIGLSYSLNNNLTGDGSTSAYTIDSDRTANDILVSVNGIIFHPSEDYTISGTTLNFTVAPTSGDEIRIRYLPV